mmetsp:Transcript_66673/g.171671  ORF Transcript_66673/g.171671 Transcript_66673/m.171671 type:complete len:251 (+) Transcript_66673:960-1712(+)
MTTVRPSCLGTMRRLDVQVLEHRGQRDVSLREPLNTLLRLIRVGDEAADLASRELVVVDNVLVHSLKARGLVEGGAALRRVLAPVEDWLALLRLEDALVARLCKLWAEPVVIGVLLYLLQRDNVRGHRLQLLQDKMLAPTPRERPLLAVWVDGLRGVQVRQDVPVHHLELLAQPLCVEGPAVADHSPRASLLRCGDDRTRGDRHASRLGIAPILQDRYDVQAQRSINVLRSWAIGPRVRDLYPLRDWLLE